MKDTEAKRRMCPLQPFEHRPYDGGHHPARSVPRKCRAGDCMWWVFTKRPRGDSDEPAEGDCVVKSAWDICTAIENVGR
jgi:hypothetical protein